MEEICDTPAELLASRDPGGACAAEAWQTVGGKGEDFLKSTGTFLNKKTAAKLAFPSSSSAVCNRYNTV
ncbi:hypothetical protein RCO48_16685 [Peribacillus frigoritolerans]|nr:hypothetical protein [Peribacillus frigoritolerans]